jgi:hypothetical protein
VGPEASTTEVEEDTDAGPPGGAVGYPRAPTINAANIDVEPPAPLGVRSLSLIRKFAVTYMDNIDKTNYAHGSHSLYA